jgi:hypothetical protein
MTADFSRVIRLGMGRDMDATHLYSGHLWSFVLLFILEYCFYFFVYCLMTFVMYPFAKLDFESAYFVSLMFCVSDNNIRNFKCVLSGAGISAQRIG